MTLKFNLKDFNKKLERTRTLVRTRVARNALKATSDQVLIDAKKDTPVDTGKLRDSLKYKLASRSDVVRSDFSSEVDYALYVHEDLTAKHTNGSAKFLIRAVQKGAGVLRDKIGKEFRRLP